MADRLINVFLGICRSQTDLIIYLIIRLFLKLKDDLQVLILPQYLGRVEDPHGRLSSRIPPELCRSVGVPWHWCVRATGKRERQLFKTNLDYETFLSS